MKNKKAIVVFYILIFIINYFRINVYAYKDNDQPYQNSNNYRFNLEDVDCDNIKRLYKPDNTEIPNKYRIDEYLKQKYNITIPVANQKNLGLCDTFATVKCVETNYALKTGQYIDLSERYLDYMSSKYYYSNWREPGILPTPENNYTSTDGDGSYEPDIMTFLKTFGAATEKEIPYDNYSTDTQDERLMNATMALSVTSSVKFPNLQDIENKELKEKWIKILKIHLMKYGSINTPVDTPNKDMSYNSKTNAKYYKRGVSPNNGGHAISIIGWDDNFSKDNFTIKPEHDGAFILLNSWGSEWGENGYYYVSYDDDNIVLQLTGVLDTDIPKQYNQYLHSDKLFVSKGHVSREDVRFFAKKYTKKSKNEFLNHITIGAAGYAANKFDTKVRFYLNPNDDSFNKDDLIFLGETNETGFSTLYFDKPIRINGKKFSLVFQMVGEDISDFHYCDAIDMNGKCLKGNVYGSNSFDGEWKTAYTEFPIYLFTVNQNPTNISIKKLPSKTKYKIGETLELNEGIINATLENGIIDEVPMTSDDVEITGYNANQIGEQNVTVTCGGKTTKFKVTVEAPQLTRLEIITPPNKTEYKEGESFNPEGLKVKAIYSYGNPKENIKYTINDGENLTKDKSFVTICYTENNVTKTIKQTIKVIEKLKVEYKNCTEIKKDNNSYIKGINPETAINTINSYITTNGTEKIFKGDQEIIDVKSDICTGEKIEIQLNGEKKTSTLVVTGDSNGDGNSNIKDILLINKHRLGKTLLNGEYLIASDVNSDNKADMKDILKINKYRLGKITIF